MREICRYIGCIVHLAGAFLSLSPINPAIVRTKVTIRVSLAEVRYAVFEIVVGELLVVGRRGFDAHSTPFVPEYHTCVARCCVGPNWSDGVVFNNMALLKPSISDRNSVLNTGRVFRPSYYRQVDEKIMHDFTPILGSMRLRDGTAIIDK